MSLIYKQYIDVTYCNSTVYNIPMPLDVTVQFMIY